MHRLPHLRWLVGLLLLVIGTTAHADITTGLVGWWKMNEGSGTQVGDSSPGGTAPGTHHGTRAATTGDGPDWAAGQIGTGSLLFDAANQDHVTIPHHADFNITADLTLTAWIKRSVISTNDAIIAKTNGTLFDWELFIASTNLVAFYADTIFTSALGSTGTVADTNWHLVAATRSTTTIAYYIDGAASGTRTATAGSFNTGTLTTLLGSDATTPDYFGGNIDDARVYNRALPLADIQELFAYTETAPPSATRRIIISKLQGPRPWIRPRKYRATSVLPWLELLGLLGKETPTW